MNIHERIAEQTELAKTYAEDGAFYTAAGGLRRLADEIEAHARACDMPVRKTRRSRLPKEAYPEVPRELLGKPRRHSVGTIKKS